MEHLYLNINKSHLFCKYVRFLGCVCGQNKIFMDGDKISAILDMPEPRHTQSEVRSFLGAVGFYRKWISNYSELATPLVELLKGKEKKITPGVWTTRQSESVMKLKQAITRYPVLRQFDQTKEIFVVTDASDYAIGGCLFQYHGVPPVSYTHLTLPTILLV